MSAIKFELVRAESNGHARLGRLTTPHGTIDTPAFMPVGTRASVKGLMPDQLKEAGAQIILANTYHLALRPGPEVVAEMGGLHRFMGWDGPILTDSGGFQVFSLSTLCAVDDAGATFKSHIDGAALRFTPPSAVAVQEQLGADIIMAFDQCPPQPAPADLVEQATHRTIRWARQCREAHRRTDQALFGIVQGGLDLDLRLRCLDALVEIGFPGYAIGGLSVGEPPRHTSDMLRRFAWRMPTECPRYLMGVGRPVDIIRAVDAGVDMFDCVLPTRNGRNAFGFTDEGFVKLRNSKHKTDSRPLEPDCPCYACRRFSRAYLRHLFLSDEMLGPILVSLHNIAYYHRWMRRIREAISNGSFAQLLARCEGQSAKQDHEEDPA